MKTKNFQWVIPIILTLGFVYFLGYMRGFGVSVKSSKNPESLLATRLNNSRVILFDYMDENLKWDNNKILSLDVECKNIIDNDFSPLFICDFKKIVNTSSNESYNTYNDGLIDGVFYGIYLNTRLLNAYGKEHGTNYVFRYKLGD